MKVFGIFAIAATILFAPLSAAFAQEQQQQGASIIMVDLNQVLSQTVAGKAAVQQVSQTQTRVANELQAAQNTLAASFQGRSEAELQNDPQVRKGLADLQALQKTRENELQTAATNVNVSFRAAVDPIILEIAKERQAILILNRESVIGGAVIDVTGEVIKRMDARFKTLPAAGAKPAAAKPAPATKPAAKTGR